jgi:hypothetical protein
MGCGNGPNPEFVLGRMFQCSLDSTSKLLWLEEDKDKRAASAKRSYDNDKCAAE